MQFLGLLCSPRTSDLDLASPNHHYPPQRVEVAEVLEALDILEVDHKEPLEVEEVHLEAEVAHLEVEEVDLLVEVDFLEAAGLFLGVHLRLLEVTEVDLLVEVDFLEAALQFLGVPLLLPGWYSRPGSTHFSHASTFGPPVVDCSRCTSSLYRFAYSSICL